MYENTSVASFWVWGRGARHPNVPPKINLLLNISNVSEASVSGANDLVEKAVIQKVQK